MRPKIVLTAAAIMLCGATARGQTVRLSGTVVDQRQAPITGATVRITGSDTVMTTGPSGTFSFGSLLPGRVILSVAAPGFEFRSIPLEISGDTVVTVAMRPRVASLDPMIVRPRLVRIKGRVVDSISGDPLLFALVSLYPGGRSETASNIGNFTFDTVPAGPVTVVAEAIERLPVQVQFEATRDTTLRIALPVDPVAVRMMAEQVTRLTKRSNSIPLTIRSFNSEMIERERRSSVGEVVDRMMIRQSNALRRANTGTGDACVFFDDRRVPPGMLDALYPEVVERIEVYGRGAMIRVYSKRYVMSLVGEEDLRGIKLIRTGMGVVCD